jgi:hypothetical protein
MSFYLLIIKTENKLEVIDKRFTSIDEAFKGCIENEVENLKSMGSNKIIEAVINSVQDDMHMEAISEEGARVLIDDADYEYNILKVEDFLTPWAFIESLKQDGVEVVGV